MQLPKNFLWVALVCLVGVIAYTIVNQGGFLKQFSVGSDGISMEFDQLKDLPGQELAERQNKLEQKIANINNTLEQGSAAPQTAANNVNASYSQNSINLNGRWNTNVGFSYLITQYANEISIQEFSPVYGITAVGQGQINGQSVSITYQTALNTQGNGVLNISPDGRSINGQFRDHMTGNVTSVLMYR